MYQSRFSKKVNQFKTNVLINFFLIVAFIPVPEGDNAVCVAVGLVGVVAERAGETKVGKF